MIIDNQKIKNVRIRVLCRKIINHNQTAQEDMKDLAN